MVAHSVSGKKLNILQQAAIHDYLKSVPRSLCKNLSSVASLALLTITFLISDLKSFSVLQVISWVFVS